MVDPELLAIATGAAANLTSEMLQSGWPRARAALARVLGHSSEAEQAEALSRADEDRRSLVAAGAVTQAQVREDWEQFFVVLGQRHAESLPDLRVLAQASGPTTQIQRNEGSGNFIGGNVYGGLTINQGSAGASTAG